MTYYRVLLADGKANVNQLWGIVTLLVSKLAGNSTTYAWNNDDFDMETGILKVQKKLAEYIEFMATGIEFHRDAVLNMHHLYKSGTDLDNDSQLVFGNKMAILAGDMMLVYSSFAMLRYLCKQYFELP